MSSPCRHLGFSLLLSSFRKAENRAAPKTATATPAVATPPITAAV